MNKISLFFSFIICTYIVPVQARLGRVLRFPQTVAAMAQRNISQAPTIIEAEVIEGKDLSSELRAEDVKKLFSSGKQFHDCNIQIIVNNQPSEGQKNILSNQEDHHQDQSVKNEKQDVEAMRLKWLLWGAGGGGTLGSFLTWIICH